MIKFNLSDETTEHLISRFLKLKEDRDKVRLILSEYVEDYRSFNGSNADRMEYLREKYLNRAPGLTHLVFDKDGEILWSASDIGLVLGRDSSTITRTLNNIEQTPEWRVRLFELRKTQSKSPKGSIYAYRDGIFELLIDFYEASYLQRFSAPRKGEPQENAEEVLRFWEYLKLHPNFNPEDFLENFDYVIPASIRYPAYQLTFKEIIKLVVKKMFTLKTGTLFLVLFALCYELARRWNPLYVIFPIVFTLIFAVCIFLMHRGKFSTSSLSNLGAGSLLFCLLWSVGVAANDGKVYMPDGRIISAKEEKSSLIIYPTYRESFEGPLNDSVSFSFAPTLMKINQVKEFFYRVSPDIKFCSAGHYDTFNPRTKMNMARQFFVLKNPPEEIYVEVKFIDQNDVEHGIFSETFELSKLKPKNNIEP